MSTLLSRVHRGLFIAVAALLMLSTIAPTLATAQEGGQAADLGTPDAGTDTTTGTDSGATTDTTTTTEATEAPAVQAPAWAQPIDYGVVVNNYDVGGLPGEGLAVRAAASPDAQVLGRLWEGERVEVTSQKFWNGDTPYYLVNYGAGGGYVNAYFILLDSEAAPAVTEAPVETLVPTEVPVTEVPVTEVPVTEVPVTEVPVETIAPTEIVTEAPVTEAPAETLVPTEAETVDATAVTEVPTNVVVPIGTVTADSAADVTETPAVEATETTSDDAAGTPAATETVEGATTEVPTDAAATPGSTDASTTTSTPEVTETTVSTETPADAAGTPVVTTETPAEVSGTPVATETVTPGGPDLSKAIGSATVTGTNGEGIRCRVSADPGAATIVVLAEGTVVQVFDTSTPGWLQISCGGQLGYGDINYLYTGGASDDQINQGGRLTVSGTGGGGVNCRTGAGTGYGVITVVSEGTALTVRGQAANGWTPVTCGGQNGYIYSQYIAVSTVSGSESTAGSGTASVTGTGGDGVRCRTAASTSASVIMVVSEGTSVTVRGASSGGWTPVTCGGQNGYISSQYLGAVTGGTATKTATATATATKTATATTAPGGSTGTGYVKVTGSGGGVNCRTGAGTNYGVITVVAEGGTVQTRSGSTNGWQAVICGGQNGFILASLTSATSGGGTGATATPTATATSTPGSGSGATGTATVSNTGGDGVYCRASAPSGNPITILAEGSTVSLRGTANNGWQPVICGGQNGFVSSQFLTLGGGGSGTTPTATATTTPGGGSGSGLANGDHAKTQAVVNLRYSPSMTGSVAMSVEIGIVVLVTGTPSNGFYPISYDGLNGWIHGDYLVKTSDALSKRGGSANPGTTPTATATSPGSGSGGGSATGNALVSFAMGYLGYPYVAATHGPASFDCSGFTYWVVYNVTGQNIWYGLWTQISAGTPVDRGSLQPGDLVFFQNTYTWGLSHVGIYIGNGKFIHAENESTGVVISDLSSQ
ncbi:MAG: SH3 domain-containing protein, partial [Thermomicrobiales bacterium]